MSAAPDPRICEERDFETSTDCMATRKEDRFLNTSRQEIIRGSASSCACVGLGGVAMRGALERGLGDWAAWVSAVASQCCWESCAAAVSFL